MKAFLLAAVLALPAAAAPIDPAQWTTWAKENEAIAKDVATALKGSDHEAHANEALKKIAEEVSRIDKDIDEEEKAERQAVLDAYIAGAIEKPECLNERRRIADAALAHRAYIHGSLYRLILKETFEGFVYTSLTKRMTVVFNRQAYEAALAKDPIKGKWNEKTGNLSRPFPASDSGQ